MPEHCMEDFAKLSDRKLGTEADAAEAAGDRERLMVLDAEWARRRKLRRGMPLWSKALCFFVLWFLATQVSALFFGHTLVAFLNGLWIAVACIMIINGIVVAWRKGRV
jgi:hypothetical protein